MGAIQLRLGAELRARWRAWLGLALLLALFAGLTFATAAGARRTDTAYERLLAGAHPYDRFLLGVGGSEPFPLGPGFAVLTLQQLDAMRPLVTDYLVMYFFNTAPDTPGVIGTPDARFDRTFNQAKIIAGHLPDAADEVGVPVAIADRLHARVGRKLTITLVTGPEDHPTPVPITMRVSGIIAVPGEFPPESDLGPPNLHVSKAFFDKYETFGVFPTTLVRLHRGTADQEEFDRALAQVSDGKGVIGFRQSALTRNVDRSFHLQAVALELFALCLAIVAALVIGQTLGRQAMTEGVEYPALRALGMTRRQLFTLGVARAAIITATGILLALPIAYALSPFAPTGLARAADPDPGFHLDAVALFGGAGLALALMVLLSLLPAARAAKLAEKDEVFGRAEAGGERASRTVAAITRAGASAPAVVGMRLALEPGRGRTAVPVRTTIAGVALAVLALTVALSFGSSLNYLLKTPRLYGLEWDADISWDNATKQQYDEAMRLAKADPNVAIAAPIGAGAPMLIDGIQADAMALPAGDNTWLPPIEIGRAPQREDEVALGPKTLRRIHKSIGDQVEVSVVGLKPETFRIVGQMVLPTVGHTANLGEGSLFTFSGTGRFFGNDGPEFDEFAVRFKAGVKKDPALAHLQAELLSTGASVAPPATPGDLLNFGRSKNLPLILSGLLTVLALATLAHALVSSINRRRRDLAICKTLGFTRRDVARAVAWQSSTFILVSLAFGLLIGVITGRWLWNLYASGLGILGVPRVPLWTLLAIVPIAAVLANALAVWPARSAARTRPALVLRTE